MATPQWNARHNGLFGDASAMADAADVNQLLGTHAQAEIYQGALIVSPSQYTTGAGSPFQAALLAEDFDQPFTMSGTAIGRVQIPMLPVGNGADLLVSLCVDNSGAPGAVITQARVPAAWIYQLSAVSGTSTGTATAPTITYTNNPLAVAQFSMIELGNLLVTPYPTPATSGIAAASSSAWYGGYVVQIGGVNSGVALSTVFTIAYADTGAFDTSIPQPAFPTANDGSSATIVAIDAQSGSPVVVNTGGGTSFEGPAIATTYTSGLDTSTGSLSAWSAQTVLPYAVQSHAMATYNGYVYAIGGKNSTGNLANVTYAQVQNSQIASWAATTPLPQAMQLNFAAAANGYLFVCGGENAGLTVQYPQLWYAAIKANGSLGPWIPGPTMPLADINLNDNAFINDYCLICGGDSRFSTLTVGPSGPGAQWIQSVDASGQYPGFYDAGNGSIATGSIAAGLLGTYDLNLMPYISVPLPTTGLTNGATYHILMQQQGGDLNDYLLLPVSHGVGIAAQTSARLAYTWTAWPNDGSHLVGSALSVFDLSPALAPGILPLHMWDDNGARITTLVNNTTPDLALIGLCEATAMVTAANENTGAATTLAPWVATGGTLARSQAEVFEGLWSFQLTPSGSASSVFMQSEFLNCLPGQSITISGWVWCTIAVGANFSMSIDWYTNGEVLINTSSNLVSIPGTTWTFVTNTFTATTSGGGAYHYTLNPTLSGTPSASNVTYFNLVIGYPTLTGAQLASVAQVVYPEPTWPAINPLKPTGTTVLA